MRTNSRRWKSVLILGTACSGVVGVDRHAGAATVTLNSSQSYVEPTSTNTSPGATSNGNGSTGTWSFTNSTTAGASAWSDGPLDNPASSASYNNSSGGATTPSANTYNVTGTSSIIMSVNSPYLAVGASTTFYGASLNLTYGTLNLNTIYDASAAATNTYNFTALSLNNSSVSFNDYFGSLYKVLATPISLSGSDTFNSSLGSYTESETFSGNISGSGTMTFGYSGGSTRVVNITGTGNSYTGAVTLGTTSGTSTFALNKSLGAVTTYTIGTSWTLTDAASNNINGSNAAVTGTLSLGGATETLGNLTGAGTVTSATTTALTLNGAGTFSGTVSGSSLSIIKGGSGVQILSGTASYGGSTTINSGTLTLGNGFTGTGAVTLNAGTLASGTATTIAGSITAGSSANTIAPGGIGSVGVLTIGGTLTTANTTTINFDLGTGTGEITNGDLVSLSNTPNIAAGTTISFNNSATTVIGNDYRLFEGGGASSISSSSFNISSTAPGGQAYAISSTVDPGYIDLVVSSTQNSLTWNNAGGTGDGVTWDSSMQNWNNGSVATNFNSSNMDVVTFNDTNSGNYNVSIPATVTPGSTTVTASGNYNFSGAGGIGGSGGLILTGTGTVTLATSDTFTGGTNLSAGTLNLANTSAVLNSTVTLNGGSLTFAPTVTANAFTLGGLAGSGNISLTNTATTPIALSVGNNGASTTYSGNFSGTGSLVKLGSGTLTLTGSSTYTGGTTLAAGILNLGSSENPGVAGPLGASGTISFTGGTLQYSSSNQYDYSSRFSTAAGQAFSIDTNSQNITFATGLTSSGGSLTKLGAGTLTLNSSSTYTGSTTINAGTLQLGVAGAVPVATTLIFSGTSTFDQNGFAQTVAGVTVAGGVTATLANGTLNTNLVTFTGATASASTLTGNPLVMTAGVIDASAAGGGSVVSGLTRTVASQITGTGGLTIKSFGSTADNGGGSTSFLTLGNANNSFTGGVTITQGFVSVNLGDGIFNNAAAPATNAITLDAGAGLIATTSAVTLNTSSIALSGAGNHYLRVYGSDTLTINGNISDGGAGAGLYKTDGGTVVLAGSNTYTGITTVQDGTLTVNGNESAATGGWTIGNGSGYTTTVNFASGSTEAIATGKAVTIGTLPGGTVVSYANQTLNVSTGVTNAGSLSIGRSGYLSINSGGTWNQSGAFTVQPVSGSGYSAYVTVATGGTFYYTGTTPINASGSYGNTGGAQFNIAGGTFTTDQGFVNTDSVSTSGLSNNSSGAALIQLYTGGTITLTANIPALTTTAGDTFTFALGNGSGGVINTNGFNTSIGTVVSNMSGQAGLLNVTGGGALTLTAANTFTGGLDINSSTVFAGNNNAAGTGAVVLGAQTGNASFLVNGAYNIANAISTLATSPNVATIGGSTDSLAKLTGTIALGGDTTFTQVVNTGTNALTITGTISSGNPGTQTATFAGPGNINVTGPISDNLGSLAVTVSGGITTLSGTNAYSGLTSVTAGKLQIVNAVSLPSATTLNISSGATTTILAHNSSSPIVVAQVSGLNNSGLLDIANNDFIVKNAGATGLATITAEVKAGFNGGSWANTTGVVSSAAAADSTHITAVGTLLNTDSNGYQIYTGSPAFDGGITPGANDVILKYTYYGDANLDGAVDGSDYTLIDNGFANHLTGWQNGDFNYDGVVDGSDYTLIDNAFNTQGATLGVNPAALIASSAAQFGGGSAAVPEPTTVGLLGISGAGLLARRRRK